MSQLTAATAVHLFEAIDRAMERAQGGKFRAFNLVTELRVEGLDVVVRETSGAKVVEAMTAISEPVPVDVPKHQRHAAE